MFCKPPIRGQKSAFSACSDSPKPSLDWRCASWVSLLEKKEESTASQLQARKYLDVFEKKSSQIYFKWVINYTVNLKETIIFSRSYFQTIYDYMRIHQHISLNLLSIRLDFLYCHCTMYNEIIKRYSPDLPLLLEKQTYDNDGQHQCSPTAWQQGLVAAQSEPWPGKSWSPVQWIMLTRVIKFILNSLEINQLIH